MDRKPVDILNKISSVSGLMEQVFGKYVDGLVYNQEFEKNVEMLEKTYKYHNARHVFGRLQENGNIMKIMKVLFNYIPVVDNKTDD